MSFKIFFISLSLLFIGCHPRPQKLLNSHYFSLSSSFYQSPLIQEPSYENTSFLASSKPLDTGDIPESCFEFIRQKFRPLSDTEFIPSENILVEYKKYDKDGKLCPTDVVVPDGITIIGRVAFSDKNLTSVVLPESLETIQKFAFEVNNLVSVTIPGGVRLIEEGAFERNNLSRVDIKSWKITIKSRAFRDNDWFNYVCIKGHRHNVTIEEDVFDVTTRVERTCPRPHP